MNKFILLLSFSLIIGNLHACTCTPENKAIFNLLDYWESELIFIAQIEKIESANEIDNKIIFSMEKIFKGNENLAQKTWLNPKNCGINLVQGKTYLIYAKLVSNKIVTQQCSKSRPIDTNNDFINKTITQYYKRIGIQGSIQDYEIEMLEKLSKGQTKIQYPNGTTNGKIKLKPSKNIVKIRSYHPNGLLKSKGKYKNGTRHGKWKQSDCGLCLSPKI